MTCQLTEMELWSGLDRDSAEIRDHLKECGLCRDRARQFEAGIGAVADAGVPQRLPVPDRIGPYRIIARLGEGGMGIVYEGEQTSPRRSVAIKVMRGGSYDEYRVKLFQREAQTLARLRHPAIGSIYEAGRTEDGRDYFTMELVRGIPLTTYVQTRDIPTRDRLDLFRRICDAITYAHQRGVIHRDIKPSNILVDLDGDPKILDFGLARITDADGGLSMTGTEAGRVMGTLPYMSPEEARGDMAAIDVRSDVYSLGVVFYELLTGTLPYHVSRTKLPEAVRVICEEKPQRPSTVERALRGDLETIILTAIEKEPERRYQSPSAMSEDIRRFLCDEPILARPASVAYRFRKLVIRHKLFFGVLMVLVASLSGATAWVHTFDTDVQSLIIRNDRLHRLQVAKLELRLAKAMDAAGDFAQAEPPYRNAMRLFFDLGHYDEHFDASLSLARLLMSQGEKELVAAEDVLLDTLNFLDRDPERWADAYPSFLKALEKLYGPEYLNDAVRRAKIEEEMEHRRVQAATPS